jgi:hypothetical protein
MTTTIESRVAPRVHLVTSLPFFGVHLEGLGAFWTGVSWNAVLLAAALPRPHVCDHRH